MIHELKTWPEFFAPVIFGAKRFEVRRNDRNFSVGDTLRLREWDQYIEEYTGREVSVDVTYKMQGTSWPDPCAIPKPTDAIQSDFVILGITCPQCARFREKIDREKMADIIGRASLGEAYCRASNDQELFYEHADALIKYLTE